MSGEALFRYLRCAYDIHIRGGAITPKSMAEEMHVRRPTAFEFIKKLESRGFLRKERREYVLTASGLHEAERLLRNHRIVETLLFQAGVGLEDACHLAEKLEASINDSDVDRICRYLGDPRYCPHGKPIPRGDGS